MLRVRAITTLRVGLSIVMSVRLMFRRPVAAVDVAGAVTVAVLAAGVAAVKDCSDST